MIVIKIAGQDSFQMCALIDDDLLSQCYILKPQCEPREKLGEQQRNQRTNKRCHSSRFYLAGPTTKGSRLTPLTKKIKNFRVYRFSGRTDKYVYADGAIREMVIWRLPHPDSERPHGLKYRLYYGYSGRPLVRYDIEIVSAQQRERWLAENPQAPEDYNAYVERIGVFSDGLKQL